MLNYQNQSILWYFTLIGKYNVSKYIFRRWWCNYNFFFFFIHFIHNRPDSDQWSESKRQLHLWNTRSNQCLWLIHYKLKECCLSTCLWWHVQYNCEPLHGSSPNLPRQMTFLLLLLVRANFFHSHLKPAFLYCLTVYWCFATAAIHVLIPCLKEYQRIQKSTILLWK